ncbi:sensor domain-containing diguanylate cyclase [Cryptosporangium aurantiacum]|uniref:sensor domain-containing diguanylate cyclase n=1 Tax=Cryptosporangium aurantiacum TaxID=134849 RepID=UPI0009332D3C|nr:GGDEF domain-containing protein [Cryptosporangium aurantiacum]
MLTSASLRAVRGTLRTFLDALCVIAAYLGLLTLGYGGDAPWVCLTLGALGCAQQHPGLQRFLAGGDLRRRPILRMALLMATGAAFVYATGWGPVLLSGLALVVALHMRLSGSRMWRPGLALAVAGAGAGQVAIALGAAPSYLPVAQAHAVALAAMVISTLIIRTIGLAAAERDEANEATLASERRFRALVQDSGDALAVSDADGVITYVSPAVRRVIGIEPDTLIGSSIVPLIHVDDLPAVRDLFAAAASRPGHISRAEIRARHVDGTHVWVEACMRDLTADPDVRGYIATVRDITVRKAHEQQLAYAASHDSLTGLVNRAEFGRGLDVACETGRAAVLFVDLDGFKQVNDRYGHDVGDALLLGAAELMRTAAPAGSVVGRFGGDEFGLVLPGDTADGAIALAERILDRMNTPVRTSAGPLLLRASIGVAMLPDCRSAGASGLLRAADLAMYDAKRSGTHRFQVASPTQVAA